MTRIALGSRRLAGVALLASALGTVCAGCTFNGSPIHSGLTPDEVTTRVNDRWQVGMSPRDAEIAVRDAGLDPEAGSLPPVVDKASPRHGMTARVEPPGFRVLYTLDPVSRGELYFRFDQEERLERVAYRSPRGYDDHQVDEVWIIVPRPEKSP